MPQRSVALSVPSTIRLGGSTGRVRCVAKGSEMTVTSEQRTRQDAAQPPVPEPGQVVNVRGSTWAVADVRQQGLPRSPADEGLAQLTHVVSLQSLDEDRLGEELAVV